MLLTLQTLSCPVSNPDMLLWKCTLKMLLWKYFIKYAHTEFYVYELFPLIPVYLNIYVYICIYICLNIYTFVSGYIYIMLKQKVGQVRH